MERAYDARAFAQIMLDLRIVPWMHGGTAYPLGLPHEAWSAVAVTGERGLRAGLLSLVLTSGDDEPAVWLMQQSDPSFDVLQQQVDAFSEDWYELFCRIGENAAVLGHEPDTITLLRRYDLPASDDGLRELDAALCRERLEAEARRDACLATFRQEIEAYVAQYSDRPIRAGGTQWDSMRFYARRSLAWYVVEHGHMPRGKMREWYWTFSDPQPVRTLRRFVHSPRDEEGGS